MAMTMNDLSLAQGLIYRLDPKLDFVRMAGAYFRKFPCKAELAAKANRSAQVIISYK
jgi:hypothetical protein